VPKGPFQRRDHAVGGLSSPLHIKVARCERCSWGTHMTNLKLPRRRQFLHLAAGAAALPAMVNGAIYDLNYDLLKDFEPLQGRQVAGVLF
jgi:hypothetical protein